VRERDRTERTARGRERENEKAANPRPGMKHSFQFEFDSGPFLGWLVLVAFPLRFVNRNRIESDRDPSLAPPHHFPSRSFTHFRLDAQKICSHRRYKSRSHYIITASSPPLPPLSLAWSYIQFSPTSVIHHAAVQSSSRFRALSLSLIALLRFPAGSQHEPSVLTSTSYPTSR
jgi:hypothetical protein